MILVEFIFVYGMSFRLMLNFLPMEVQMFLALIWRDIVLCRFDILNF